MKTVKAVLVFFFLLASGLFAFGQQGAVITIKSDKDSSAVDGAICILQPLQKGARQQVMLSDKDGKITYNGYGASLLTIQSQGYKIFADTIEPGKTYTVWLQRQNVNLDEVVITGQYNVSTADKSV